MNADRARGAGAVRSPSTATFLSFLWPGLGQWYLGRNRLALVYGLPVVAVALAALWQLNGGLADLAIQLFAPSFSLTVLVLIVLLGVWRLISMADAFTAAPLRTKSSRRPTTLFAVLALLAVIGHAAAGFYAWSFYQAGSKMFVAGLGGDFNSVAPGASGSGTSGDLVAKPGATPATADSRINILLTGVDSSVGRNHALNDTIIVASVDPKSRHVVMLSFPRDIAGFPLWNGGTFSGKINSLMTYAGLHKDQFPDGPLPSLIKELGYLLGVPIHYYAAVDLDGFRTLIDKVGGIDINNPRAINDPDYGGWTDGRPLGFSLSAGVHHLDGQSALAYARSRKGSGDNDFTRARRQQQLLVALARKLTDPSMLTRLPDLLAAASQTVRTNFPADRLSEMLSLSRQVKDDAIQKYVLGPPYALRSTDATTYSLKLDLAKLSALSIKLFGADSRYAANAPASPSSSP